MGELTRLVVNGLAVYRATRLVTTDTITEGLRDRVVERGGLLAEGVECDWCVGLWLSAGAVGVAWRWPRLWRVVSGWLALGAVVGVVSSVVGRVSD